MAKKEKGKLKDGLFFYEREGRDLIPVAMKLPVICSIWKTERDCSVCKKKTAQQFVELEGKKSPLKFWYCCSCKKVARVNSRP